MLIYLESFVNSIGRSLNRPPVRLVTTNDSCCDNRDGAAFFVGLLLTRSFFFGALAGTLPLGCGRAALFFAGTVVDTMLYSRSSIKRERDLQWRKGGTKRETVWTIGKCQAQRRSNLPSREKIFSFADSQPVERAAAGSQSCKSSIATIAGSAIYQRSQLGITR